MLLSKFGEREEAGLGGLERSEGGGGTRDSSKLRHARSFRQESDSQPTASRAGRAGRSAVAAGVRALEREGGSSCEDKSLQGHEGRPFLRVAVSAQIRKIPSDHSLRNLQFGENRKLCSTAGGQFNTFVEVSTDFSTDFSTEFL